MPGITVTARLKPSLRLTRVNELAAGFAGGNIDVRLPFSTVNGSPIPGQEIAIPASKAWIASLSLAISTPLDLDLAALVGGLGDVAFSTVRALDVRSLEAPGSGKSLRLGGAGGATEWAAPIGVPGDALTIAPGVALQLFTLETGGWPVGARHILRFDPGAASHAFTLALAGD